MSIENQLPKNVKHKNGKIYEILSIDYKDYTTGGMIKFNLRENAIFQPEYLYDVSHIDIEMLLS